jgi:D-sedoheptulose 7-phosphate isomerase
MEQFFRRYLDKLTALTTGMNTDNIQHLAQALQCARQEKKQVFLCGNGGSAANAMHIANDLIYGISKDTNGICAHALSANQAVMTCLANDVSYDEIFSLQLGVHGKPGDILIALSGSGNSMNIVKALEKAKEIGMKTFAILGYSGGKCLNTADIAIHFRVDDMQISEDLQLVVGHMIMQWLRNNAMADSGLRSCAY